MNIWNQVLIVLSAIVVIDVFFVLQEDYSQQVLREKAIRDVGFLPSNAEWKASGLSKPTIIRPVEQQDPDDEKHDEVDKNEESSPEDGEPVKLDTKEMPGQPEFTLEETLKHLQPDEDAEPTKQGKENVQGKKKLQTKRKDAESLIQNKPETKETDLGKDEGKVEPLTGESTGGYEEHKIAGLNCDAYGGPSEKVAAEMVYWRDIPSDAQFVSPFKHTGPEPKYLTFEPDEGGWNNIRMSMETAVAISHAMGRILVMPPEQGMYLLHKDEKGQKNHFSFTDFFHFDSMAMEHAGVEIISFEEFLKREVMTGQMINKEGNVTFPPNNRTNWNGTPRPEAKKLDQWVRSFATNPIWSFDECMAAFPAEVGGEGPKRLHDWLEDVKKTDFEHRSKEYFGHPVPVDGSPRDRLRENLARRDNLCIYTKDLQDAKVFHLMGDNKSGARLLVHFYAFLFFEDWKQDLWTKRFVRDHLRYVDEIQCAAARVVAAVRKKSRENGDPEGKFQSFHIRRGDFQYKDTRVEASIIYENIKDVLRDNETVYIATDERDKQFFKVLKEHYNVYFLDDFETELNHINTNFFGMLDQRIASRGEIFIGCFYSTFTGYINRMRGYHHQLDKGEGWEDGIIRSYYYIPKGQKLALQEYRPITPAMWAREFPVGWRDLDQGTEEIAAIAAKQ